MTSADAVFRFIYNAVYTFFFIVLITLAVLTPADVIYRAWENGQTWNIWIVVASYVLTFVVVAFVYATRLYINKTALAAIPKPWIPVEKGDVHPAVYRLVKHGLDRSAAIAFEARPRIKRLLGPPEGERGDVVSMRRAARRVKLRRSVSTEEEQGVVVPLGAPVWGGIEQPGWGSPTSPDLADLQYSTVFLELPALIEAKALTFAPEVGVPPALDPEAIALLQRPASMGLRDYVGHLASLGVLPLDQTALDFIHRYEHARFSTRPISDAEFRELMRLFAEVLRTMGPAAESAYSPSVSTGPSVRSRPYTSSSGESYVRRRVLAQTPDEWEFRTAPTTPKSAGGSSLWAPRGYPASSASGSVRSGASGSVVRYGGGGV